MKMLLTKWKENIMELESSRNRMVWNRIVNDINFIGPKKNINQAKKKMNNLKDAYKKQKKIIKIVAQNLISPHL